MAYTPNTWVKGDTITSAKMNHMEAGISHAEEYVDRIQGAIDELEAGSLSAVGAAAGTIPVADGGGAWEWKVNPVAEEVADLKSAFTTNGIKIVGQIASTVTTISSLTEPGLYFIPKTYVGNLTDKPSDMSTANNYALLVLYSAGQKVQQLLADWVNFDTIWDRHKTTTTWSTWNKSGFNIDGNIGARAILFSAAQSLTDAQKTQALSNIGTLSTDKIFTDRGSVDSSTTALSSLLAPGAYFISSSMFSGISDLPSNIVNNNSCVLMCYPIDTRVAQWLWQKDSGYLWMRYITISTGVAGDWTEINDSKYLVKVSGADANNITWNGWYGWGSTETVYHVPNDVAAGMLYNVMRTATTKYQIGIDYFTDNIYFRNCKLGTWSDWKRLAYSDEIKEEKKSYVIYQSGSYAEGIATERLNIYLPAQNGYILYRVYHCINTDTAENYNVWRVYQASRVDDLSETGLTYITTSGEWECAIHLYNRSDFSGGSTHGDEVMTNAILLIDGLPTTISSLTSMTEFSDLRLIRTSNLYDPDDHTTVIAEHGVEYVFTKDGLKINQSINWAVAEQLERCYLAMFLPSKARIDRMAVNSDFEILELPSDETTRSTAVVKPKGTSVTMWDTDSGVSAEVSIPIYPAGLPGGDTARIQDNSTTSTVGRYNKLYYTVCESGNSSIGELWESTTIYKIDYKPST